MAALTTNFVDLCGNTSTPVAGAKFFFSFSTLWELNALGTLGGDAGAQNPENP
jgi:hypothetical protein